MARGIARVTLVGNLTQDPELRQTAGGTSVCTLRVAVNSSYKDASGQWVEKPNFFDVKVWGVQGENTARYLSKGRQVAVDGRLDHQTWEAQDGTKRSKVEVIADTVMFLGGPSDGGSGGGGARGGYTPTREAQPPDDDFKDIDFGGEDDIPF
ncbi:MAG: single-stranded DNA-binding protein [Thermoleophilia bacterium]